MKKNEEKLQDDLFERVEDEMNWDFTDGFQGRSENQIKNNARVGGCTFVLFIIALVWYAAYELIKWLS